MQINLDFLKKKSPPGLCCLYLLPDRLIVTHALFDNERPKITFYEDTPIELNSFSYTLDRIIKKHALNGMPCSWVLHDSFYQIFLLDPPSVPAEEIPLALRWQLKELIDFPTDEAAIQYFSVPFTLNNQQKIYVSIAKKERIQPIADIIYNSALDLQYIDIGELALRNITALYEEADHAYLGFLAFNESNIELMITREKNLLLKRKLETPSFVHTPILSQKLLTALSAEIQNSFSYCKGQEQHEELPVKLLVSSPMPDFLAMFSQYDNIPAEPLHIRQKIDFEFVTLHIGLGTFAPIRKIKK